jgi:CHAT domain-containing protein
MPTARAPVVLLVLAAAAPARAEEPPRVTPAECEVRVQREPASLEAYRCFWLLARQGRAGEAEARLGALLARDPRNDRARFFLARIAGDAGRDAAEPMYRQATAGFAAKGDARGEVLARLGLGLFLNRRHRAAEFEAEIAAARRLAATSGDRWLASWVHNEEAALAFRKGDFGGAWRQYKEVEATVVPDGPLDLQALCFGGLGGVYLEVGRIEDAADYTRRAAALCRRAGDFYDEARHRGNLVLSGFRLAVLDLAQPEDIVPLAREALAAAQAGGNRGTEARAHLYLGDLLAGEEARAHYRLGLEISRETKETAGLILGLRGLALSLLESEPRDEAQAWRLVAEALDLARGSRWYSNIAWLARARMRWMTGPRDQAVADSLSALDAIESMRDLQDDGLVRARVFSMWSFAYDRLAGHLLSTSPLPDADRELAFSVLERRRARVLLDELDAALATGRLASSGPRRERHTALLGAIAEAQRRLLGTDGPAREAAVRELERLELKESAARTEMLRADPRLAALRRPERPRLAEVEQALGEDEALLSFEVASRHNVDNRTTEGASRLWVHTRRGTLLYPVPDRGELRGPVALFLGLVQRRDGSERGAAAALHRMLLERALSELPSGTRRLVIVPDGVLHRLPFHALRPTASSEPLGMRFQTSMVPSVTLWLRWRREAAARGVGDVLALSDPTLAGAVVEAGRARPWEAGPPPGPLPYARREGRFAVGRVGGRSLLRAGEEASEGFLKGADLTPFSVVHLAAHAVVDEDSPDRSAVLLAPGGPSEDGMLQIREIVSLDLHGKAIVLSACRSASGTLLEGEGVMGLARGFFQAGARAVVGSLWPLRDDEAERLVRDFYRHLAEGRAVADAMAAAQRDRLHAGEPDAAWAGLVVLGDGDLAPVRRVAPPLPLAGLILIVLVLLVSILLAGGYRVARRRRLQA